MRLVAVVAAFVLVCIAGLGFWLLSDDDAGDGGTETEVAAPPETGDPVPMLPPGWTKTANAAGGFALGVPPGWSAKERAAKTTLRSPGSPVVVSVTADRSDEAIEADLADYALGTATGLVPEATPEPVEDPPRPSAKGYESAAVAIPPLGKKEGQGIEVIVVRRVDLAAYPVLVARDASVKPGRLEPIVRRLVSSLRGQPVTPVQD